MSPGYGGDVITPSKRPPKASSRASPRRTPAAAPRARPRGGNPRPPGERAERVPTQESPRLLDGTALPPVLVTPVRRPLRRSRKVEVEVRRPPGRARGARQHDTQDVGVLVVLDEPAEKQQFGGGTRREPVPDEPRDGRLRPPSLEPVEPRQR